MKPLLACFAIWAAGAACVTATDRIYNLPCQIESFSPSGDGTIVWVSCFDPGTENTAKGLRAAAWTRPSTLYALDLGSGNVTALRHAFGGIQVIAAPKGSGAIVVIPREKGNGNPFLYIGKKEISALPIGTEYMIWSADARKIYFEGGSTLDADAWNILGMLRLSDFAVSRAELQVPTEDVSICATNGHLFAGIVSFDRLGNAEPYSAAEYDSELRFIGRNRRIPPGRLSVTCRYAATPGSFSHGPARWRVIDTATGRQFMSFEFDGEGSHDDFQFVSWNPTHDDLLLRFFYPSRPGQPLPLLQVFDVLNQRVVDTVSGVAGDAAWSADGSSLMFGKGQSLISHNVPVRIKPR